MPLPCARPGWRCRPIGRIYEQRGGLRTTCAGSGRCTGWSASRPRCTRNGHAATLEEAPESPDAVHSGRVGRVAVTVTNESPRRGNVEGGN